MKIETAEFERSVLHPRQFQRDGLPEIAFVGRSNVGKSTLLNSLLRKKGLARTSSTPGRTQAVNYFLVNRQFRFVDLPGYGFAKASKSAREKWAALMDAYFRSSQENVLLVQLIDSKVGATNLDVEACDYFESLKLLSLKVATKIDKVSKNRRHRHLGSIHQTLELPDDAELIAFSAMTGEGTKELWSVIFRFLDDCRSRPTPSFAPGSSSRRPS